MFRPFAACAFFLLASLASAADSADASAPLRTDHLRSQLLSSQSEVVAGQPFWVGLRLQHEPQWHTYWKVSGDAGLPTEIQWQLPVGWKASAIHWPVPHRASEGNLTTFALTDDALLLVQITPAASPAPVTLTAQAHWLICRDVCIPGQGEYQLKLNVASAAKASLWEARLQRAQQALPQKLTGWKTEARWTAQGIALRLKPQAGQKLPATLTYFPNQPGLLANAVPQKFSVADGIAALLIPPAKDSTAKWKQIDGLLVADEWAAYINVTIRGNSPVAQALTPTSLPADGTGLQASARPAREGIATKTNGSLSTPTWWAALLGAFIGGLILNLMPCVFPVLSIKVVSMVQHEARHPGVLHRHGLLYTAGVLTGFLALAGLLLAVRAAGSELGWGFQLQNPWFVLGLAVLFTLIALNLFGVFEVRWGQSRAAAADLAVAQQAEAHPYLSAIFTGLLAVVVASPCSAPFMGAALGFALTQTAWLALLIFAALGLGLALPYLLLCYWPGLLKRLPRSGGWMEGFKQLLAFPMLATVAWLLWVYGLQTSADQQLTLLLALCALALVLWLWGRQQRRGVDDRRKAALVIGTIVLALAAYGIWRSSTPIHVDEAAWQPYSEARMQAALAKNKTVFVDFTAAWCVTCQVNKQAVLETEKIKQALATSGIVLLRADWTKPDSAISAALQKLGRNGIPVYWLQRPNQPPVLLPEVLTTEAVLSAINPTDKN